MPAVLGSAQNCSACNATLASLSLQSETTMKTDTQLYDALHAELMMDPVIDATRIKIDVQHGIVTLSGQVCSYAEKLATEKIVQSTAGVVALAIEIEVRQPGSNRRNDTDIARAATDALNSLTELTPDSIRVMAEKGWVTLSGGVEWQFQQIAANRAVRSLRGVIGVFDHIAIAPPATADSIQATIESALQHSALDNADNITVTVSGADVTLSGDINSWTERSLAKHSAWATPGVHMVVDHMKLSYS